MLYYDKCYGKKRKAGNACRENSRTKSLQFYISCSGKASLKEYCVCQEQKDREEQITEISERNSISSRRNIMRKDSGGRIIFDVFEEYDEASMAETE